jgi:hypothetical protein
MAMYSAFFDDSGTHTESKVAVAACFISDKARWTRFDEQWRALLEAENFDSFHYSDFLAGQQAFRGWSKTRRARVMNQIIEIATAGTWEGYVTAVIKSDYDRIIRAKLREKVGKHPYTFAVQACMALMRARLPQPAGIRIRYVFDQMPKGHGEIDAMFSDLMHDPNGNYFGIGEGSWVFQSKKISYPLQVADILACEAYRYMRDCVIGKTRKSGPVFRSCVGKPIFRPQFFDSEALKRFAAETTEAYEKVNWRAPRGAFF